MSYEITQLDLDITGRNINNRILDEPHSLANRNVRSIAPNLGPFFSDSLVVKDNNVILTRGVDYQIVELHQEATLLYGKEISSVILIINRNISSNVTITYQALGGHFSYSSNAIANMYQTITNDTRAVDWVNVLNKPSEFTPTVHRHLLDDVFGFEPIVDHLERIKRAITLGQVSVVLEIINSLLSEFTTQELRKNIPSKKIVQYDALLFYLSRRKIISNIYVDRKETIWVKGTSGIVVADTSGYPVGTPLYWELYKPDSNISLYSSHNGVIHSNGGIVEISIYTPANALDSDYPIYLGIKENPTDVDYKAVTYTLDVEEYKSTDEGFGILYASIYDEYNYFLHIHNSPNDPEMRLWRMLTDY